MYTHTQFHSLAQNLPSFCLYFSLSPKKCKCARCGHIRSCTALPPAAAAPRALRATTPRNTVSAALAAVGNTVAAAAAAAEHYTVVVVVVVVAAAAGQHERRRRPWTAPGARAAACRGLPPSTHCSHSCTSLRSAQTWRSANCGFCCGAGGVRGVRGGAALRVCVCVCVCVCMCVCVCVMINTNSNNTHTNTKANKTKNKNKNKNKNKTKKQFFDTTNHSPPAPPRSSRGCYRCCC